MRRYRQCHAPEHCGGCVRRERPDLVMTDLRMPRLDGIQLTRYIRRDLPGTRIIMISSYAEDTYWLMASDSRADAFVSKRMLHSPAVRPVPTRRPAGSHRGRRAVGCCRGTA